MPQRSPTDGLPLYMGALALSGIICFAVTGDSLVIWPVLGALLILSRAFRR